MTALNKLEISNNLITDHFYKNPDINLIQYEYNIEKSTSDIIITGGRHNKTRILINNYISIDSIDTLYAQINEIEIPITDAILKNGTASTVTIGLPLELMDPQLIILPVKQGEWKISDNVRAIDIYAAKYIKVHRQDPYPVKDIMLKFASLLTMKFVTDSNVEVIFKNAIANSFNSDSKFEKYSIDLLINKPKGQMITQETLYINQDDEYQIILPDPVYKIEMPSEVKRITISNYNKSDIGVPFMDIEYRSRFENDINIALNLIKYTIQNKIIYRRNENENG